MAFTGRFVLNVAYFAAQQGAELVPLIKLSGMSETALCDETCMVNEEVYSAVTEEAIRQTKDELFGLHLGESLNLSAAGLIVQIVQTSETVKQALEYCCQFYNLGCRALPMTLVKEQNSYKVSFDPDPTWADNYPTTMRHTADGVIAFTIREFHSLTRLDYQPIKIHVPWKVDIETAQEYQRVCGCTVFGEQDELALYFRPEHIEAPVITSNYHLLNVLVAHATAKQQEIEQQLGFLSVIKKTVIRLMKPTFPSITDIAKHLNLGQRTLQRRLKKEGHTYKQIIDGLKHELALTYLNRQDLSIGDVAYLLDYSDTSTFIRSFKRWTNKTPSQYRLNIE